MNDSAKNSQAMSNLHAETQKNLQVQVMPILERLHSEIKAKEKEMDKGAAKGTKVVDKSRAQTQKEIERLGQITATYKTVGTKASAENDPYVIHRGVLNRLHRQLEDENATRDDVITVQQSFGQFEAHVVETFSRALAELARIMGGENQRATAIYETMAQHASKMQGDFEWKRFVIRNSQYLIDPQAGPRSIDQVQFANRNHESVQPILAGILEKKGKLMGKYDSAYFVLTPAKYLHEYKDKDASGKDASPDLSLYLPDCSVGTPDGTNFSIKGKNTSHGGLMNKLARASEVTLQAQSPADAQLWYRTLVATTGQVEGASSTPASPVSGGPASSSVEPTVTEPGVGHSGTTTSGPVVGEAPVAHGTSTPFAAVAPVGGPVAAGQTATLPTHTVNQGPTV